MGIWAPSDDTSLWKSVGFSMSTKQFALLLVSGNEGSTVCWVNTDWSDGVLVIFRTDCTDGCPTGTGRLWFLLYLLHVPIVSVAATEEGPLEDDMTTFGRLYPLPLSEVWRKGFWTSTSKVCLHSTFRVIRSFKKNYYTTIFYYLYSRLLCNDVHVYLFWINSASNI